MITPIEGCASFGVWEVAAALREILPTVDERRRNRRNQ